MVLKGPYHFHTSSSVIILRYQKYWNLFYFILSHCWLPIKIQ